MAIQAIGKWLCDITPNRNNWKRFGYPSYRLGIFLIHWREHVQIHCPRCKGEGGERDPVLYNGIGGGPWYDCEFCNGKGHIKWWGLILEWLDILHDWLCRRWYEQYRKGE